MNTKKIRWRNQRLQFNSGQGWRDYSQHPAKVADFPITNGSAGYATMQKLLLEMGYTYQLTLEFKCPGCGSIHEIYPHPHVDPDSGKSWEWNHSTASPTFSPGFRFIVSAIEPDRPEVICSSHIEGGKIHFLNDSTHGKAGDSFKLELI